MQYDEQSLYTRMTARYQELAGFVPDEASDIALRFHAQAVNRGARETRRRDGF